MRLCGRERRDAQLWKQRQLTSDTVSAADITAKVPPFARGGSAGEVKAASRVLIAANVLGLGANGELLS